jgi:phosphinothricin acetyltransferase
MLRDCGRLKLRKIKMARAAQIGTCRITQGTAPTVTKNTKGHWIMTGAGDMTTAMDKESPKRIGADSLLVPKILTLVRQAFAPMEARINPPSSMNRMSVSSIQEDCASGELWAIGDPPLACVFLRQREDSLYISKLAVSMEMRGQGCARRLIELAESRATAKGLSSLELETYASGLTHLGPEQKVRYAQLC